MNTQATWKNWLLAGVTVGALGLTAVPFAPQVSLAQSAADATTQPAQPVTPGDGQRGMKGSRGFDGAPVDGNRSELLAAALGITVDELTAAQTAAQEAGLARDHARRSALVRAPYHVALNIGRRDCIDINRGADVADLLYESKNFNASNLTKVLLGDSACSDSRQCLTC